MSNLNKFIKIFIFFITIVSISFAQNEAQEITPEQKAWLDYMTPTKAHKMLAGHEGEWKIKTTYWMTPNAEPTVSEGSAINEMIMGGRYLQSKNS